MSRNKKTYHYIFSNNESHFMTPIEGQRYAHKHKVEIIQGPNYVEGKKQRGFDGWGWHDSLQMTFRGPRHYKEYLRENRMEEWGDQDAPQLKEIKRPKWDEALIRKANNEYGMNIGGVLAAALLSGELDYPEDG